MCACNGRLFLLTRCQGRLAWKQQLHSGVARSVFSSGNHVGPVHWAAPQQSRNICIETNNSFPPSPKSRSSLRDHDAPFQSVPFDGDPATCLAVLRSLAMSGHHWSLWEQAAQQLQGPLCAGHFDGPSLVALLVIWSRVATSQKRTDLDPASLDAGRDVMQEVLEMLGSGGSSSSAASLSPGDVKDVCRSCFILSLDVSQNLADGLIAAFHLGADGSAPLKDGSALLSFFSLLQISDGHRRGRAAADFRSLLLSHFRHKFCTEASVCSVRALLVHSRIASFSDLFLLLQGMSNLPTSTRSDRMLHIAVLGAVTTELNRRVAANRKLRFAGLVGYLLFLRWSSFDMFEALVQVDARGARLILDALKPNADSSRPVARGSPAQKTRNVEGPPLSSRATSSALEKDVRRTLDAAFRSSSMKHDFKLDAQHVVQPMFILDYVLVPQSL